jgi:hypothetical protein
MKLPARLSGYSPRATQRDSLAEPLVIPRVSHYHFMQVEPDVIKL